MQKYRYILGLDMGVGSTGWACVLVDENDEPYLILDLGSRIYDPEGASVEDRRIARGTRRVLRRRKRRVQRTKNLFFKNHFLSEKQLDEIFKKNKNPYELRIKGKTEALSYEELLVVLVHYAKGRGFKSNRKIDEQDASKASAATEEQKLLYAKQKLEEELAMKKAEDINYTITNYLLEKQKETGRMRNTGGEYLYGITRSMIEEEVMMILDKQKEYHLIDDTFIEEYKEILFRQRMFSEGPDHGPYHDPLNKMIGKCGFEKGQPRAPKASFTYELFTLVQKLQDLRYHEKGNYEKKKLTAEQVEQLVTIAKKKKKITYGMVKDIIGEDIEFYNLRIGRNEYIKIVKDIAEHSEKDLNQEIEKAKLNVEIYKLKQYEEMKKQLKKLGIDYELSPMQYDLIADCLSRNKSDAEMERYLNGERDSLLDVTLNDAEKEAVRNMKDKGFKEFGKVSLKFLYNILPHMIRDGMNYYEACKECGYDHTNKIVNDTEYDEIPVIDDILEKLEKTVTNKTVVRTLVETRKVVNAIIRRYGKPIEIHIELARELTKDKSERKQIQDEQQFNQIKNDSMRAMIFSKHPDKFRSVKEISSQDLIQYRLFMEQGGICPYTLAITGDENASRIDESQLFTYDVEIDHIIPYTKTFDDRYENKALVLKKRNAEKGNRIPYEYFKSNDAKGIHKYTNWIKQRSQISIQKKERYFAQKIDEKFMNDYRARTINDTRYAAKAFKEILGYSFPNIKNRSFTGQVTAKLRAVWGLNSLTHSMHEKDYTLKKTNHSELNDLYKELDQMISNGISIKDKEMKALLNKIKKVYDEDDEVKNRENHLHHALDAVILACATDKVRRRVEIEEMVRRQKGMDEIAYEVITKQDESTGDILETKTEYMTKEDYQNQKDLMLFENKNKFPLPYAYFDREVILRVYEKDPKILKEEILNLYKDRINSGKEKTLTVMPSSDILSLIKPLFVSHHYSAKISGQLHKATYYGVKEAEEGLVMTERMSIASKSFNEKKLEQIYDKDTTQRYIYEAVKEWLGSYKTGEDAYHARGCLPKNKNGNVIKKVKLNDGIVKESFAIRKGIKQYVDKTDVLQVYVYRRKDDDKLYFVGMDRFRLMNADKREDLTLLLWWGQGKNNISIKMSELKNYGFVTKPLVLYKGQTILLETNSGKGLCQLVGFSSGMLEIESNLGDAYDLLKEGLTAKVGKNQYQITVSTIKSIKPISVDVLGKIHSNVL